jgi:hypothetical protein
MEGSQRVGLIIIVSPDRSPALRFRDHRQPILVAIAAKHSALTGQQMYLGHPDSLAGLRVVGGSAQIATRTLP